MFDLEISFDPSRRATHESDASAPNRTAIAQACEACGYLNPTRYQYCVQCGSRADGTLAYGAHVQIECGDDVTAVFEATEAGWPSAGVEDTVQLHLRGDQNDDLDDAPAQPESFAANDAPTRVGQTEVAPEAEAALLLQLAADGDAGQGTPIAVQLIVREGFVDIGCDCEGPWADDAYLDAWHVRLLSAPGGVRVWDEGSRGGVWMRLEGGRWLLAGDRFRLGTQFLRFDAAESCAYPMRACDHGRVQLLVEDEQVGPAVPVTGELVLGREAADATFPHDPYVSAQHCRLVATRDGVWLEDLASSNGTYVRMRSGEVIPFGSVIAIGSSRYRVESGEP